MPYGGTSPEQDVKIERCVNALLANAEFRKGQEPEARKSSAIALCKSSVMGQESSSQIQHDPFKRDTDGKIIVKENVPIIFTADMQVQNGE